MLKMILLKKNNFEETLFGRNLEQVSLAWGTGEI